MKEISIVYSEHKLWDGNSGDSVNDDVFIDVKFSTNCTIHSGAGNDTIVSGGNSLSEGNFHYIFGDDGDDNIKSELYSRRWTHDKIYGGRGDDTITSFGADEIFSGEGNDVVETHGRSFVDCGLGNDSICFGGGYSSVICGKGNDTFSVCSSLEYETILGGEGNDRIHFYGENCFIDAGDGNDSVGVSNYRNSSSGSIKGGKGDDIISGEQYTLLYSSGDGNDIIDSELYNDITIKIESGNLDAYSISGEDGVMRIGSGTIRLRNAKNQQITVIEPSGQTLSLINSYKPDRPSPIEDPNLQYSNDRTYVTIMGGYDKGTLTPSDYDPAVKNIYTDFFFLKDLQVVGNDKDNVLQIGGRNKTISGGKGNDKISAYGIGSTGNDSLSGDEGNDEIYGGDGIDTILGGTGHDTIDGSSGNDKLYGEDGNDSIIGGDGHDTIDGGSGNDYIDGGEGSDNIYGGNGNDNLTGGIDNDIIDGESGDDFLVGGKGSDALFGGMGNDTFVYSKGDGKDTIHDYNAREGENDKLQFKNVLISKSEVKGNDVVIHTADGGSIKLMGAKGKTIKYVNMRGNTGEFKDGNYKATPDDFLVQAEVCKMEIGQKIEALRKSIISEIGTNITNEVSLFSADEARKYITLVTASSSRGLKSTDIPDIVYTKIAETIGETLNSSVIKKIKDKPIEWTKQVYSQIQNGLKNKTENVTYKGTKYEIDFTIFSNSGLGDAFVTVSWGSKKAQFTWTNVNTDNGKKALGYYLRSLSDLNKELWKNFIVAWVEITGVDGKKAREVLDYAEKIMVALTDEKAAKSLIAEFAEKSKSDFEGALKKEFKGIVSTGKKLLTDFIVKYIPGGDKIVSAVSSLIKLKKEGEKLYKKYDEFVNAVNKYKNSDNTTKILALYEEFQNAATGTKTPFNDAYLDLKNTMENYVSPSKQAGFISVNGNALNSTKLGADEFNTSLALETKTYVTKSGVVSDSSKNAIGSLTLKNDTLRYDAVGSNAQNLSLGSAEDMRDWSVNTSSGTDTISVASSQNTTVNSGAGKDKIVVTGTGSNHINAGKGHDVIQLKSGKGTDTIAYANGDGKDVIYSFGAGKDVVRLSSGKVSKAEAKDKDVVLTVGKGSVRLSKMAGKRIDVIGTNKKTTSYLVGSATAANKMTGTANASVLMGGSKKDTLTAGKGGATIQGGKGNDCLVGGAGKDVFLYADGDGNDVIRNYTSGKDVIQITKGSIKSKKASGKDVILTVGKGKMTVKGAMGKKITVVNANGKTSTVGPLVNNLPSNASYKDSKKTVVNLASAFSGTFDAGLYATSIKTVDATKNTKALTIKGNANANLLKAGSGNSKLYGEAGKDTLVGGKGKDYLEGGTGNDSLVGGKGNDSLHGGAGDDMLKGGAGNDTFFYASNDGNDVIQDYEAKDAIHVESGTIKSAKVSGNQVVFFVESGKISVNKGKGKKITVVDANGKKSVTTFDKNGTYTYSRGKFVPPAQEKGKSITVSDNYITIAGGNGNDTIDVYGIGVTVNAANGNDTVSVYESYASVAGGAGDDNISALFGIDGLDGGYSTFLGGSGNDKISVNHNTSMSSSRDIFIDGGSNNDIIHVSDYISAAKIYGGSGDDDIDFCSDYSTIDGGAGNDTIFVIGNQSEVSGGKGNDEIYLGAKDIEATYSYSIGDGDDTVYGYTMAQAIKVLSGNVTDIYASADMGEVTLKIGTGSIHLKYVEPQTYVNVRDASGNATYYEVSSLPHK